MCQTLWTQDRASYSAPELSFEAIHQMPKPVQSGGVPLWISGTVNRAVARRITRFGSGWIPWGPALADPAGSIAAMKDAVLAQGGDPTGLQVQGFATVIKRSDGSIDTKASVAPVPKLVAAGVSDIRFVLSVPGARGQAIELLATLVEDFREVTR